MFTALILLVVYVAKGIYGQTIFSVTKLVISCAHSHSYNAKLAY